MSVETLSRRASETGTEWKANLLQDHPELLNRSTEVIRTIGSAGLEAAFGTLFNPNKRGFMDFKYGKLRKGRAIRAVINPVGAIHRAARAGYKASKGEGISQARGLGQEVTTKGLDYVSSKGASAFAEKRDQLKQSIQDRLNRPETAYQIPVETDDFGDVITDPWESTPAQYDPNQFGTEQPSRVENIAALSNRLRTETGDRIKQFASGLRRTDKAPVYQAPSSSQIDDDNW